MLLGPYSSTRRVQWQDTCTDSSPNSSLSNEASHRHGGLSRSRNRSQDQNAVNKQSKIDEASYFYDRMAEQQNNPAVFRYYLSAFLSAARAVLQYALTEAKRTTGGEAWYRHEISISPVLRFFGNRRTMSMHDVPARPGEVTPMKYFFDDWTDGGQDVMALSNLYLDAIRATVERGIAEGFLTRS